MLGAQTERLRSTHLAPDVHGRGGVFADAHDRQTGDNIVLAPEPLDLGGGLALDLFRDARPVQQLRAPLLVFRPYGIHQFHPSTNPAAHL